MARVINIRFNTGRIKSNVRGAKTAAMTQVAGELSTTLRNAISTQGPPRSLPGEYPHKDSGNLHRETRVVYRGNKLVVRTLNYGKILDERPRMGPRPWITPLIRGERVNWERRARALIRRFVQARAKRRVRGR